MKILFIAPHYLNLYKPIYEELCAQGHDVTCILQDGFASDPYLKIGFPLFRIINLFKWKLKKIPFKYWFNECKKKELRQKFDLLFVIQGTTFDSYLLDFLRKNNPSIKSSLYIWDSNRWYDFFRNAKYFDKVFSFDLNDVRHSQLSNVSFLPFYWTADLADNSLPIKYAVSSIGTNHHGRLAIYKQVYYQLQNSGIPNYIKLVVSCSPKNLRTKIRLFKKILMCNMKAAEEIKVSSGDVFYPFVTTHKFSTVEYNEIILQSKAVLDTDNPDQFGTTPRLIWALAANKHIYTTNTFVVNFPFYNSDFVHIIDRKKPILDLSLLDKNTSVSPRDSILNFRIDNWVKNFIE